MVAKYPGRVTFVSENLGESALAKRFGVTGYPAVFVNDILVARPRDFGYFGQGDAARRYAPWKDAANHEKFRQDLVRMVDLVLAGRADEVRAERGDTPAAAAPATAGIEPATLPSTPFTALDGRSLSTGDFKGRVVVVEFWATWCPPCRSTLGWLADLAATRGDDLAVLAFAVESDEKEVRAMAGASRPGPIFAVGTPEIALAFGDVVSVPTLFVFDRDGKAAYVSYGAPPNLHETAGQLLDRLTKR
ncbi:MAG TPA: TlpA disulfide reductase family protein [Candidatus Polarisedimenticolia bacterium]|nr:TlpA disulfide reductase family protein [Candidatus Polarisedimenticolia bacterium]